ncbi:MAG: transcriptional regulator MntR [Verrucomicrobiales bacterium]|nr:transcriptional regulator MntR [Verrucomicrobiales bacterium]
MAAIVSTKADTPRGTRAQEDYLEQILSLIEKKGYARVVDIAKNLNIAQASVTGMIQRMDAEGLVSYEKYRGVILTSEGEEIARAIINRHESLTEFFKLFGLYDDTIYEDIEGIEHHMSPPTLATIQALTKELERQPALLDRVKSKVFQAA